MSAGPDPEQWEHDDPDEPGLDIDVLRRRRERVLACVAVFFILVVSLLVVRSVTKPMAVERTELIAAAKQAVREAAPGQTVLAFSTTSEFRIEMVSSELYSVRGELQLLTHDGHSDHFFFVCLLTRAEAGPWRPVRLSVTPG